jgi:hypothetical protein
VLGPKVADSKEKKKTFESSLLNNATKSFSAARVTTIMIRLVREIIFPQG